MVKDRFQVVGTLKYKPWMVVIKKSCSMCFLQLCDIVSAMDFQWDMSTIIPILGVIISIMAAVFSFYFSIKSKRHAAESLEMIRKQYELSHSQTINQYINEACESFKQKGTPFYYINSLNIAKEQKEEIWRQAFLRYKGRPPKKTFLETSQETDSRMKGNFPTKSQQTPQRRPSWINRWRL